MKQELVQQLYDTLQTEYHGDVERLLADIRKEISVIAQTKSSNISYTPPIDGRVVIQLRGVSKEYKMGKEIVHAVKPLDLDVYEGEMVALIGPSGSGKSSLLQLIGGLDAPTAGEVTVHGSALKQMKDRERSQYRNQTIGFIFQFFHLQPYLTVEKNVEVPLIFRGESKETRKTAAREAVEAVGLTDRIEHLPNQLSGGQMQRVAIARAIVNKPKIILADEPTGNLDKQTGNEIMDLLITINKQFSTTMIIVTHDPGIASHAHRVITLSDGAIVSTI